MKIEGLINAQRTSMLFWALTIIGRNTAVNARDNFMVAGKDVIGLREGRDSSWDGSFGVDNFYHF